MTLEYQVKSLTLSRRKELSGFGQVVCRDNASYENHSYKNDCTNRRLREDDNQNDGANS